MKKILLIEPIEDDLELLKEILEDAGFTVFSTTRIDYGFDILRQGIKIDMIFIDYYIDKRGKEGNVLNLFQEEPLSKNIPLIALTSTAVGTENDEALKKGYAGCVAKPIEENLLLETVNKF